MTDFVIRGKAKGDQMTLEAINEKFNACIDWTKLRASGLTLEEVSFDLGPAQVKTWIELAPAGIDVVTAEGCNGICFVEVYQAEGEHQQVFNGIADQHVTNAGDLIVTLKAHDEPWMVRVIRP